MPDLPRLAKTTECPDPNCKATLGTRHTPDCSKALCLETGAQRKLHLEAASHLDHDCGQQAWTGYPPGAVEAAAHDLFVRLATPADQPHSGWIPCEPGTPGAVPDLDRVMRIGQWDRDRQRFHIPADTGR